MTKRVAAGIAGLAISLASVAGLARALAMGVNRFGSFRVLALILPALYLWRYALTGRADLR